ncbi:hypothetical protein A2853_03150 [Candidatus Kaiserbacteria bacterium RIFCSPHIGHO2_01_FULL_55_17]|uniref:Plasmid stabilization protein n=1 Tax=Candidatus Kaiserbacteria bacterium RIFCSPHIGHO2_01_FULL_55_17 TaxID=1798484 RepID=A0A1F6DA53_9BACT|nr:MAG: hypothetical protein A2853_03150 [Candidatus Kaiserbacteria bacterium RIFCSPHIGHO2_01_FULL_55_17]
MRVIVDEEAWNDLSSIGAWIGKDSPKAARETLERILEVVGHLEMLPRLGHPGRVRGTYERGVAGTSYIIVYEISGSPSVVIIAGIVHGARDR